METIKKLLNAILKWTKNTGLTGWIAAGLALFFFLIGKWCFFGIALTWFVCKNWMQLVEYIKSKTKKK